MNLDKFNHDTLILPSADTNPARYKLPTNPFIYPQTFELPGLESSNCNSELPSIEDASEVRLPGNSTEIAMELSRIPGPYRDTVRYIHKGISPMVANGIVYLSTNGSDIHHIVKRATLTSGFDYTRAFLPFNGAVKQTFEALMRPNPDIPKWVSGNLLINYIPLDYSFHHRFIEERPFDHTVFVRYRGSKHPYTLPELLMSFAVFNLESRLPALVDYVQRRHDQLQPIVEELQTQEYVAPNQRNLPKDLAMWQRMQIEMPRIPVIADELRSEHGTLYSIWKAALGPRTLDFNKRWMIEQ